MVTLGKEHRIRQVLTYSSSPRLGENKLFIEVCQIFFPNVFMQVAL
jgi:hypothetical protein